MNPTKFYHIDNEALYACASFHQHQTYIRPFRKRRSSLARLVPVAIALIVAVGISVMKLTGA